MYRRLIRKVIAQTYAAYRRGYPWRVGGRLESGWTGRASNKALFHGKQRAR
jgi:hypothetical protein